MDGGGDGVLKALIGVGREVDGDARAGRDRSGDLDIEGDLAVGAVGIAGGVGAAIDRHGNDGGRRDAELAEVGLDVGVVVAAAQFDERDALALAVGAVG